MTPELYERVMLRDAREALKRGSGSPCVASFLDPQAEPCYGRYTLDHVKDESRMGKRAPSDERHLVVLCLYHHVWSSWGTSHRGVLRWYLRSLYENPGPSATHVTE